ncbi:MAG: hypothetical protein PHS62_00805 [Patescibacteria group bacterium]|nr:hypothetical protein [Patescibacteria group bacterium]
MRVRKLNRLPFFDYAQNGFYFVTICVKDREEIFGQVINEKMVLNRCGWVIRNQWQWLAGRFPYLELDEYIVMPNHLHGILMINTDDDNVGTVGAGRDGDNVGTGRDLSLQCGKIKSVSELIGAFKTTSSKLIHYMGYSDFAWQRSFYDHIIRNEKSLIKIREYIINNPAKWERDRNNPADLLM